VLNAYTAAECSRPLPSSVAFERFFPTSQPTQFVTPSVAPSTSNADDILIDDYIENWECCSSLHTFYSDHCRGLGDLTESLLGFVLALIACVMIKSLLQRFKIHWLPESAGCILVGGEDSKNQFRTNILQSIYLLFLISFITALAGGMLKLRQDSVDDIYFSENLLMVVFLPPIVFSAALKINKKAFRRHLIPIVMYASLGTILSAAMTGFTLFIITNADNPVKNIPLLESLIFGALISSIDPVVILNILESAGIRDDDTLYIILFGESILNDALAIVLFDTLVSYLGPGDQSLENPEIPGAIWNFLFVLIGSLSLGLLAGVFSNLFFYCVSGTQSPVVEVSIFSAWAMIPYYVCNLMNMSGIVALVAAGFFMDMYVIGSHDANTLESFANEHYNRVEAMELDESADSDIDMPYRGDSFEFSGSGSQERNRNKPLFTRFGQLSQEAREHTAFVAEVISSIAETCIFAYLGAFLFSSNYIWGWKLNMSAIVSCIGSRAVMIIIVSCATNILEICGIGKRLSGRTQENVILESTESETVEDMPHRKPVNIDCKMQFALIFAGLRGAVSLALAQSIPLYNAMTKSGTLYKAELKTMTSTAIIFTVFVFGGLTQQFLGCLGFLRRNHPDNTSLNRPLIPTNTNTIRHQST